MPKICAELELIAAHPMDLEKSVPDTCHRQKYYAVQHPSYPALNSNPLESVFVMQPSQNKFSGYSVIMRDLMHGKYHNRQYR